MRAQVIPLLRTYPSLKLWVAGCSTGEEAYSFAILLHEEGLLDRSLIYATDINPDALERAQTGRYAIDRMAGFTENHRQAGGRRSLSEYYSAAYDGAVMHKFLRDKVVFSDHSLATDSVFAEVHLVSCRNVLIYFDSKLQNRAIGLFHDALCRKGILGLGARESLRFSSYDRLFSPLAPEERIFQRESLMSDLARLLARIDAVVIGASAGGIEALSLLLPAVRSTTRAAILIVTHMPREHESLLPKIFAPRCALPVKEAEDKEPIAPGTVYFAAPDYHLQVDRGTAPRISLSYDDPVNWSRPSIDVLFASSADVYGDRLLALVLTGGNQDGAAGLVAVRRAGGVTVVQDPASALSPTMPREALRLGAPDLVLGLEAMKPLMQAIP